MRARVASVLVGSAVALAATATRAQSAPWSNPSSSEQPPPSTPPTATQNWPDVNERYGTTPDPAFSYNFQMPTARPLHHGDTMITIAGDLGWLGVRYGVTRRFDAGVGLAYYLAGVSLDARYALLLTDSAALSLWAYATIPLLPGDGAATSFLGFTWQGAGPAWMAGPVLSLWGARTGIHIGANVAQRVLLGGAWAFVHMTVEGRITDAVRAIAQGVLLAEMIDESGGSNVRPLVGNTQPRIYPYVVTGLRLHSRRFAVDFGVLVALAGNSPLGGGNTIGVWPWTSVSQTF